MDVNKKTKFIAPSWDELYWKIIILSEMIIKDKFSPDVIVAIARGGWIIGRIISDLLGQPSVANIRIIFYKDVYETEPEPRIIQPVSEDVSGKKVLIVDDVADTGLSLLAAISHLREKGASEIKTATVYCKPWSKIKPDYFVEETDAWVIFPHELRETIEKLYIRWKSENKSLSWMINQLIKFGINERIAKYFLERISKDKYVDLRIK